MNSFLASRLQLLLFFALLLSAATTHAQSWQWANAPAAGIGNATAVDAAGNVYATGYFSGTATFGATTLTSRGGTDIFIAKLNAAGTYQWAVSAGSTLDDAGNGIAVDASGTVYATGSFSGTGSFGSATLTSAGITDVFVTKLSAAGAWQWTVRAGSISNYPDLGRAIAVDASGNVSVTGNFAGSVTFGPSALTSDNGTPDIFVARLNASGAWQWAVKGGSGGEDNAAALTVDAGGNVYAIGDFGNGSATFGGTSLWCAGLGDVYLIKISNTGSYLWAKALSDSGGFNTGANAGGGLAVDGSGNVYATGTIRGATVYLGLFTLNRVGIRDIFVAKFAPTGVPQWVIRAGDLNNTQGGLAIAVDGAGSPYLTGYFNNSLTLGATTLYAGSGYNSFLAKLTPAGAWQWVSPLTGTDQVVGRSVAVDGSSNVVMTGDCAPGLSQLGALSLTNSTTTARAFVARLTQAPALTSFLPTSGVPAIVGSSLGTNVTLRGTNLYDITAVTFGGVTASVSTAGTGTALTAFVPLGAATGPITVSTPYGTATSAGSFTVYGQPSVQSLTPASGAPGTSVVISGTNLSAASAVSFGGVAAGSFTVNSVGQITATVPFGGVTGAAPVTVLTPGGSATSPSPFTVAAAPPVPLLMMLSPTSGPRGTVVTVSGVNLSGVTAVTLNGANASFTPLSSTQLTLVVPRYATTGKIQLTNGPVSAQSLSDFTVTAAVTGFAPASGPAGAGVFVTGKGFTDYQGASVVTGVSFNNIAAAYAVVSDTLLTTTVPATATTGLVRVTTAGGPVASPANYTVLAASGVVFDLDSATVLPGAQVVVPLRLSGFTTMLGLQGTIRYNPAQLTLVGVEQLNAGLTGLATSNFNTTASGQVSFAYLNSTTAAITLPSSSVAFALRFTVPATAAAGTRAPLWWAPGPVPVEVTRSTFAAAVPQALGGAARVPAAASLSGTVRTGNATAVPGVSIGVSGPLAPATPPVTPTAGTYALPALVSTGAYTLTPTKSNDVTVANGVTVTDVALIQRHILGTTLLGAAYKAVSADVNNDAAITVADVAAVQSFILGTTTSFTGGALWRFYSSAQAFANQNSPWPLIQTRTYASLATATAQDFVGCKLGDVNDSWNAAIPRPAGVAPDTLRVGFPSMTVAPAGHFRLPLVVQAGPACGGLQGEIAWNPAALRLIGTTSTRPGLVLGVPDTAAGHLPMLWTDPAGRPLRGPATLVELEFAARGPVGTLIHLDLVDGPRTPLLALDSALFPLTLLAVGGIVSIGPLGVGAAATPAAAALWPNPASETLHISGAPQAAVVVLDGPGRAVRVARLGATGTGTLAVRGLPAGVYTVRIGAAARRLVVE